MAENALRPEDQPLFDDTRWLAGVLGQVIRRLEGDEIFQAEGDAPPPREPTPPLQQTNIFRVNFTFRENELLYVKSSKSQTYYHHNMSTSRHEICRHYKRHHEIC